MSLAKIDFSCEFSNLSFFPLKIIDKKENLKLLLFCTEKFSVFDLDFIDFKLDIKWDGCNLGMVKLRDERDGKF
jgi:hypothetical protein